MTRNYLIAIAINKGFPMILPKVRDSRLILERRGGSLSAENHRLLALWAAECAEHVLLHFEKMYPEDDRPRVAIEKTRKWANGEIKVTEAKEAAYYANKAAQGKKGAAKMAAMAAGQAAAVAHVAAHDLGAAAYAIRAVMEASDEESREKNKSIECLWQRSKLPKEVKKLVIEDEMNRNEICWNVFI